MYVVKEHVDLKNDKWTSFSDRHIIGPYLRHRSAVDQVAKRPKNMLNRDFQPACNLKWPTDSTWNSSRRFTRIAFKMQRCAVSEWNVARKNVSRCAVINDISFPIADEARIETSIWSMRIRSSDIKDEQASYLHHTEQNSIDRTGIPIVRINSEECGDCLIYNRFDTVRVWEEKTMLRMEGFLSFSRRIPMSYRVFCVTSMPTILIFNIPVLDPVGMRCTILWKEKRSTSVEGERRLIEECTWFTERYRRERPVLTSDIGHPSITVNAIVFERFALVDNVIQFGVIRRQHMRNIERNGTFIEQF